MTKRCGLAGVETKMKREERKNRTMIKRKIYSQTNNSNIDKNKQDERGKEMGKDQNERSCCCGEVRERCWLKEGKTNGN